MKEPQRQALGDSPSSYVPDFMVDLKALPEERGARAGSGPGPGLVGRRHRQAGAGGGPARREAGGGRRSGLAGGGNETSTTQFSPVL